MVIDASETQPSNAKSPMLVRLTGNATLARAAQPLKAAPGMWSRPDPNETDSRLVHPKNTWEPRLLTLPGIVRVRRLVHLSNARSPMLTSPLPSVTLESAVHRPNAC
jgi:hypothetical protein